MCNVNPTQENLKSITAILNTHIQLIVAIIISFIGDSITLMNEIRTSNSRIDVTQKLDIAVCYDNSLLIICSISFAHSISFNILHSFLVLYSLSTPS